LSIHLIAINNGTPSIKSYIPGIHTILTYYYLRVDHFLLKLSHDAGKLVLKGLELQVRLLAGGGIQILNGKIGIRHVHADIVTALATDDIDTNAGHFAALAIGGFLHGHHDISVIAIVTVIVIIITAIVAVARLGSRILRDSARTSRTNGGSLRGTVSCCVDVGEERMNRKRGQKGGQ
jgi:hypothetical protein